MATSLQKSQLKQSNVLKQIRVEGEEDMGQKVVVRYETAGLKWKGFESQMGIWTKIYGQI